MALLDLQGKKGLVIGIANEHSIAWACAKAYHAAGAELAVTYLNPKAEPYVRPLAESLGCPLLLPLDVTLPGQMEAVFDAIREKWGTLDFVLHAIAFAPAADLNGRVVDASRDGFLQAIDISCHSFIRLASAAEPLMSGGGSLTTLTYHGSTQVIPGYNLMGPAKAALESAMRYMAVELGPQGIRVNAVSAGLLPTRAAKGLTGFDAMHAHYRTSRALTGSELATDDIGHSAAFLASDLARSITGTILYVDEGYHAIR